MVLSQALFAKLQQLATVAGDMLLGKEKLQKILLARLTETVVMWLSAEQEFWVVFEDESSPIQPLGLQQVVLFSCHDTKRFGVRFISFRQFFEKCIDFPNIDNLYFPTTR